MIKPVMAEEVRSALVAAHENEALSLVYRVDRCGGEDWGGQFRCRTPACRRCRWRYMRQQQREAVKHFDAADPADLAMVTVVIGVVSVVEEIGELLKAFRKELRNLIDANRRNSTKWHGVEFLVWLESDAFLGTDFVHLRTDKKKQFDEIAPSFSYRDEPVWIVTVHGLVDTAQVGIDGIRTALRERWTAHRQIDVRALHKNRTTVRNIERVVSYSLKFKCSTNLDNKTILWPAEWQAKYLAWLHRWSRGFHSMRIHIKTRKQIEFVAECLANERFEPLPFDYNISTFHTLY